MNKKLKRKRCPFCGETDINVKKGEDNKSIIWCDSCPAMMYSEVVTTEELLIKAWNSRIRQDNHRGMGRKR